MRFDLAEGVWVNLDTTELWLDPVALMQTHPRHLVVIDLTPALEAIFDRFVVVPPESAEPEYEEGGEEWPTE